MIGSVGSTNPKWWHAILYAFLLIAPSVAVAIGNDVGATILAAAGAAAIILTRLPDVVSFSGFGMSAQLDRKLQEADNLISDLRSISLAFARASLEEMASSGQRFTRLKTSRKFATRDTIVNSLEGMGIRQADILKSQDIWIRTYGHLLLDMMVFRVFQKEHIPPNAVQDELKKLPRDADLDLPVPDAVRQWASQRDDDQLIALTDEYRFLIETGGMRNPDLIPASATLTNLWLGTTTVVPAS